MITDIKNWWALRAGGQAPVQILELGRVVLDAINFHAVVMEPALYAPCREQIEICRLEWHFNRLHRCALPPTLKWLHVSTGVRGDVIDIDDPANGLCTEDDGIGRSMQSVSVQARATAERAKWRAAPQGGIALRSGQVR